MSADRAALQQALKRGEQDGGHIEFKERLTRSLHLSDGRMATAPSAVIRNSRRVATAAASC